MNLTSLALMLALAPAALYAQADEKVVLGKLGQAIKPTNLYQTPSIKSHVYYNVKQYEYIVINSSEDDKWLRVLLQTAPRSFDPAPLDLPGPFSSVGVFEVADLELDGDGVGA